MSKRDDYIKNDPLVKLADSFMSAVVLPIIAIAVAVGVGIGLLIWAAVHFLF